MVKESIPPDATTRSPLDEGDEFDTIPPRNDLPRANATGLAAYDLFEEVGRGHVGVVRRARRQSDGETVAIKTIAVAPEISIEDRRRFVEEARFLAQLTHPNVLPFYEAGEDGNSIYVVMEMANRMDAEKRLARKGPLRVHDAARLTRHVLSGLHYLHRMGVIHRDVKPSNVLIHSDRGEKRAKLSDCGLVYSFRASNLGGSGPRSQIAGSRAFMAPEAIVDYRAAGPRADQYSAAATMYYLLTRKTVREPEDEPDKEPLPIRVVRRDVHNDLAAAIHRALSVKPEDRFIDVEAFKAELRRWAEA